MADINNGTDGKLIYSYETDGRGADSWYNYRVKEVRITSGVALSAGAGVGQRI